MWSTIEPDLFVDEKKRHERHATKHILFQAVGVQATDNPMSLFSRYMTSYCFPTDVKYSLFSVGMETNRKPLAIT